MLYFVLIVLGILSISGCALSLFLYIQWRQEAARRRADLEHFLAERPQVPPQRRRHLWLVPSGLAGIPAVKWIRQHKAGTIALAGSALLLMILPPAVSGPGLPSQPPIAAPPPTTGLPPPPEPPEPPVEGPPNDRLDMEQDILVDAVTSPTPQAGPLAPTTTPPSEPPIEEPPPDGERPPDEDEPPGEEEPPVTGGTSCLLELNVADLIRVQICGADLA